MSDWRPIESAPTDRWIYLWQEVNAKVRMEEDDSLLGSPYVPVLSKWNGATGYHDDDGCPVKDATHWRELFDPPGAKP